MSGAGLRVGIVGAGFVARIHAEAYRRIPGTGVELRIRHRRRHRRWSRPWVPRRPGGRDGCPDSDAGEKRKSQNDPVQPAGHFAPVCIAMSRETVTR